MSRDTSVQDIETLSKQISYPFSPPQTAHGQPPSTGGATVSATQQIANLDHIVHGGGVFVSVHGWNSQTKDEGQCFWPKGHKYVGEWRQGRPHGIGLETRESGESYIGEWNHGQCFVLNFWEVLFFACVVLSQASTN
jgi:hypothetical protein